MRLARADVVVEGVPVVVAALVALNLAAFAYALTLEPGALAAWFDRWGLVPREFLRGTTDGTSTGQMPWITPFTSMFLHGNAIHLVGNLVYLWVFGSAIESLLGRVRVGIFYAVCGLAAALVQLASDPAGYVPTVGASGPVSGLIGAWVAVCPMGRLRLRWPPTRVPALTLLMLWVAIQLSSALGEGGSVALWAHAGGFAAGMALGGPMRTRAASDASAGRSPSQVEKVPRR
jgi:membrane associated rhomboid family serine protease